MKEQILLYPELFEYYPSTGIIEIYNCVSRTDSDFKSLLHICRLFAEKGRHCIILPNSLHYKSQEYRNVFGNLFGTKYEGKCPDLLVDGEFYEYEGCTSNNPTRNFCNMISRGIKQSERILIDDCGINKRWAQRYLLTRVLAGDTVTEVWVLENSGKLTKLF